MPVNQELLKKLIASGKSPDQITPEMLMAQEGQQQGGFLPRVGRGLQAMAQAAPSIILEGKMPSTGATDMQQLLNKAMAEKYIQTQYPSPTDTKAQMELAEIKRRQVGQIQPIVQPAVGPQEAQPTTPTVPTTDEKAPQPFITIYETKTDDYGGQYLSPKTVENPSYKLWETKQGAKIKGEAKFQEAGQKALGNFGRMASAIKLYAGYYAKALGEGGVGSLPKQIIGKAKMSWGGQPGEKLQETGKLYGQGVEMSLASIPILTGQSRFVESLRDALALTYPTGVEEAGLASSKLEQTLENMYMTSKILERLGLDINNSQAGNNLTEDDADKILVEAGYNPSIKSWSPSNIYKLTPQEQQELEVIKKDVLGNLRNMETKSTNTQQEVPSVGGTFNGEKVLKVTRL